MADQEMASDSVVASEKKAKNGSLASKTLLTYYHKS